MRQNPSENKSKYDFSLPFGDHIGSFSKRLLKSLEKTCCRSDCFGCLYHDKIYRELIKNELEIADIDLDSKVAVVGSGHYPMTVIELAKKGFRVVGLDRDRKAVKNSREIINEKKLEDNVKIRHRDGRDIEYSDFDAVWIAFSVEPKKDILTKVFDGLKEGAKMIYRNPKEKLEGCFSSVEPSRFSKINDKEEQDFGKISALAVKENDDMRFEDLENKTNSVKSLKELELGEEKEVISCPDHSCLNALGIREGKKVKFVTEQPFGGPLLVSVEGRKAAVDRDIAKNIAVA